MGNGKIGGLITHFIIIIFVQFAIRYLCYSLFPDRAIFALVLANLLIGVVFGILALPPQYRKDFYKIPFFHKYALTIFFVFTLFDLVF